MADSEEYPGPYCMKNGISTDWLISLLSNSKDGPDQPNVPDFNDPVKISLPVSDDPENETCPVCLGGCENRSYIKDCMHYFCFACIRQWSLMVETCPVCKVKVTSILHSASSPMEYQELTLSGNSETGKHLCQGVILEMLNLMERNNTTTTSLFLTLNIQISHHQQIARLIVAGGV